MLIQSCVSVVESASRKGFLGLAFLCGAYFQMWYDWFSHKMQKYGVLATFSAIHCEKDFE